MTTPTAIDPVPESGTASHLDTRQRLPALTDEVDYQSWLELQSGLVPGIFASLLVVRSEGGRYRPVALWPESSVATERLTDLIEQVIAEQSGLVADLGAVNQPAATSAHLYGVAYPVMLDGAVAAVVAVGVKLAAETELAQVMNQLQWGAAWLELKQMRGIYRSRQGDFARLSTSVDLLGKVLPEGSFHGAAMRLITELAIDLNCNLASLGLIDKQRIKLAHLSHSADFSSQMNLVRALEDAMDEAVDQRHAILFPDQAANNLVTVAHRALAEKQQSESLLTLPLQVGEQWFGAVTLQRDIDQPFSQDDLDYCESVLALASSALQEKRFNDRPLYQKARDAGREQLVRLFGPGYLGRKLLLWGVVAVTLTLLVWQGEYRLSADASLRAMSQQVISAPFDGYIKSANVRAGDRVDGQAELLQLDDRDLLLERLKWLSQQSKLLRQYQEAIAEHDRAGSTILDAQLGQVRAQLNLIEGQLQRARLLAPFQGLVVSGDLSQRIGDAVSKGDVLFEMSPVNAYRVDLLIKESRIADIRTGQKGAVYLSALPNQPFEVTVSNITPVTEHKDGATFFVVEAVLQGDHPGLRPGMEGVGKISIDQRNLFSIWTRELRDWLRLYLWRWWG